MKIKLTDKEILEIINEDKAIAVKYYNNNLKPNFQRYYELYSGEHLDSKKYRMPENAFISRDVLTTIRTIMPDINKLLFSGAPVEVTARSGEDEEKAGKMQTLLNYQITAQNPYHTIFTRLITNALITGCAALKVMWEKRWDEKEITEIVSHQELQALINNGYRVTYKPCHIKGVKKYKATYKIPYISKNQPTFQVLPYNEFLFDPKAQSISEADYVIHRKLVNYDYLKRKEREKVYKNVGKIKEAVSSYADDDLCNKPAYINYKDKSKSRKLFMINEYWGKLDINKDGLLEDVVITTCGEQILSIHENTFKMYPFFVFAPFLSMDSIAGRGLAELSENTQIIKTALIREILENTRRNNNRKIFYKIDDLLSPSQMVTNEQYVAVRDSADINNIFAPEPFESLSDNSFTLVEYFDKENQKVTGISEMKQGLQRAIESQTATEAIIKYEAANSQVQAIVLNFAETLKEVYRFLVYQNQKFIDELQVIRLLNERIEINPEDIKDVDFDLNISQALSSGTIDTRRKSLTQALAMMIEIGEPRNLTDNIKIRNLMAKILEESGLKDTENFLVSQENLREQKVLQNKENFQNKEHLQVSPENLREMEREYANGN